MTAKATTQPATESSLTGQQKLSALLDTMQRHIIGQKELIRNMLICLISDGHMLIEGMPGLAKTLAAKSLAGGIQGDFHRIQFTPDLLPSDLIGTEIYVHEDSSFRFREGPVFHNILLADEINRAPAKVQSALLEAMEEKQVTVGHKTYPLPQLFMVLATQNPIEQEGTYNLPEAQLDRFLMHVVVRYPEHQEELAILELDRQRQSDAKVIKTPVTTQEEIFRARKEAADLYIDPKLNEYIVAIIMATRNPATYSENLAQWLRFGASPRGTLAIARCARALAWLEGAGYVSPYHIQAVVPHILRHRIILSFEAEADNITRDDAIRHLLEVVAIP